MNTDERLKKIAADIEAMNRRLTPRSETYEREFRTVQARVDSVAAQFGDSAPAPLMAETLPQYRRRLVEPYKQHSPAWSRADLSRCPDEVLDVAEKQILADARREALAPTKVPAGTLVERQTRDQAGRLITKFYGDPGAWMDQFKMPGRRLVGVNR